MENEERCELCTLPGVLEERTVMAPGGGTAKAMLCHDCRHCAACGQDFRVERMASGPYRLMCGCASRTGRKVA